jgi:hypothetical protein
MTDIEATFCFRFPPDLRAFLEMCLPRTDKFKFPDWRGPMTAIEEALSWPRQGILFDVAHSGYWREEWGPRPASDDEALAAATEQLTHVPILIPIHGHSYLPAEPLIEGNPIFSVYQTDVIQRGKDIIEHFTWLTYPGDKEDIEDSYPTYSPSYRYVRFWTDLARDNFEGK